MGTAQVDDLGAFASASGTLEFEPPDAAEAGTYYVGWILDPSDEVDEYDEGDNAGHTAERLTLERDLDGDGHDDEAYGGSDCDDDDDDVHPGATEECNGRDDDCDGQEDEASECQPDDGDDSPTDDDPTGGQAAAGRRGGSCSAAPVDARLFGLLAALGFCAGRRLRRR
jgi:hypothetical protein